jgi:hypothetical protein
LLIESQIGTAIHWLAKLFSWVKNPFTKLLFLRTYSYSHSRWLNRHRLGAYWSKCGSEIEYSVHLVSELDPEPRISKIAFRALDKKIKKVSMVFEAFSSAIRYQQPISLTEVSDIPIVWNLSNIPYQEVFTLENSSGLAFSWHSFSFKNVTVSLADGTELRAFDSLHHSVTYDWFLNSQWERRWGQVWNLNAIKFAKGELALYWRFGFCQRFPKEFVPYPATQTFSITRATRQLFASSISWIMTRDIMLSIQYWLAVWSGLFLFDQHSRLVWRWSLKSTE